MGTRCLPPSDFITQSEVDRLLEVCQSGFGPMPKPIAVGARYSFEMQHSLRGVCPESVRGIVCQRVGDNAFHLSASPMSMVTVH